MPALGGRIRASRQVGDGFQTRPQLYFFRFSATLNFTILPIKS